MSPFYDHLLPIFLQLHDYLPQNGSDGHFEVLNRSIYTLIESKVMKKMQKTQKGKKWKKGKKYYTNNKFFTKLKTSGKGNICVLCHNFWTNQDMYRPVQHLKMIVFIELANFGDQLSWINLTVKNSLPSEIGSFSCFLQKSQKQMKSMDWRSIFWRVSLFLILNNLFPSL